MALSRLLLIACSFVSASPSAPGSDADPWALFTALDRRGFPQRASFIEALQDLSPSSFSETAPSSPPRAPSLWERTSLWAAVRGAFGASAPSAEPEAALVTSLTRMWDAARAGGAASTCAALISLSQWRLFHDSFALPRALVAGLPATTVRVPAALAREGRLNTTLFPRAAILIETPADDGRAYWEERAAGRGGGGGAPHRVATAAGTEATMSMDDLFAQSVSAHYGAADDALLESLAGVEDDVLVVFVTQEDALRALALGVGLCHAHITSVSNDVMSSVAMEAELRVQREHTRASSFSNAEDFDDDDDENDGDDDDLMVNGRRGGALYNSATGERVTATADGATAQLGGGGGRAGGGAPDWVTDGGAHADAVDTPPLDDGFSYYDEDGSYDSTHSSDGWGVPDAFVNVAAVIAPWRNSSPVAPTRVTGLDITHGPLLLYHDVQLRADLVPAETTAASIVYEDGLLSLALLHLSRIAVPDEVAPVPAEIVRTKDFDESIFEVDDGYEADASSDVLGSLSSIFAPSFRRPDATCVARADAAEAENGGLPACGGHARTPFPDDDTAWFVVGALASRGMQTAQIVLGNRVLAGRDVGWWLPETQSPSATSDDEAITIEENRLTTSTNLFFAVAAEAARDTEVAMRTVETLPSLWELHEDAESAAAVDVGELEIAALRAQADDEPVAGLAFAQVLLHGAPAGGVAQDAGAALDILQNIAGVNVAPGVAQGAGAPRADAPPLEPIRALPLEPERRAALILAAVVTVQDPDARGRDDNRTLDVLRLAAQEKDANALSALGFIYQTGEFAGVPVNYSAAAEYLLAAAEAGSPQARSNFAALLLRAPRHGQPRGDEAEWGGLEYDAKSARRHLELALEESGGFFLPAEFNLAVIDMYAWEEEGGQFSQWEEGKSPDDLGAQTDANGGSGAVEGADVAPPGTSAAVATGSVAAVPAELTAGETSTSPAGGAGGGDALDDESIHVRDELAGDIVEDLGAGGSSSRTLNSLVPAAFNSIAQTLRAHANAAAAEAAASTSGADGYNAASPSGASSGEGEAVTATRVSATPSAAASPVPSAHPSPGAALLAQRRSRARYSRAAVTRLARVAVYGGHWVDEVPFSMSQVVSLWRAASESRADDAPGASAALGAAVLDLLGIENAADNLGFLLERGALRGRVDVARAARDGLDTAIEMTKQPLSVDGDGARFSKREDTDDDYFFTSRLRAAKNVVAEGEDFGEIAPLRSRSLLSFWPNDASGAGYVAPAPAGRRALVLGEATAAVAAYLRAAAGNSFYVTGNPIQRLTSGAHGHAEFRLGTCASEAWPGAGFCSAKDFAVTANAWFNASSISGFSHATFALAQIAARDGDVGTAWRLLDQTRAQDSLSFAPVTLTRTSLLLSWLWRALRGDARAVADGRAFAAGLWGCVVHASPPARSAANATANATSHVKHRVRADVGVELDRDFDGDGWVDEVDAELGFAAAEAAHAARADDAFGRRFDVGPLPFSRGDRRLCTTLARTGVGTLAIVTLIILSACVCTRTVRRRGD